jgi:hypothetical protein
MIFQSIKVHKFKIYAIYIIYLNILIFIMSSCKYLLYLKYIIMQIMWYNMHIKKLIFIYYKDNDIIYMHIDIIKLIFAICINKYKWHNYYIPQLNGLKQKIKYLLVFVW